MLHGWQSKASLKRYAVVPEAINDNDNIDYY